MVRKFNLRLDEINNMLPFEVEIYIALFQKSIEKEQEQLNKQN